MQWRAGKLINPEYARDTNKFLFTLWNSPKGVPFRVNFAPYGIPQGELGVLVAKQLNIESDSDNDLPDNSRYLAGRDYRIPIHSVNEIYVLCMEKIQVILDTT